MKKTHSSPHYPEIHFIYGHSARGTLGASGALRKNPSVLFPEYFPWGCLKTPNRTKFKNEWKKLAKESFVPEQFDMAKECADNVENFLAWIEESKKARRIILWVGPHLTEQFFLAWMYKILTLYRIPLKNIEVIQISKSPQWGLIKYLGELSPDQLRSFQKNRRQFSPSELNYVLKIWAALNHSSPEKLIKAMNESRPKMPFLQKRIRLLVQEFPHIATGLNFSEFQLLENCLRLPGKSTRLVGETMGRVSYPDHLLTAPGDVVLADHLVELSQAWSKKPLLQVKGIKRGLRGMTSKVTPLGAQVLNGVKNNLFLNRTQKQICAFRLDSRSGFMWVNDYGVLRKIHLNTLKKMTHI